MTNLLMRNRYFFLYLLLPFAAFSQKTTKTSVFFDVDQARLRSDALQTLDALIAETQKMPDFDLDLEAFTDDQGTPEHNRSLAQSRADTVRAYLLAHRCAAQKTSIRTLGKVASSAGDKAKIAQARQQNRRVDILLHTNPIGSFRELDEKLAEENTQRFTIQSGKEAVIEAAGGTKIYVPVGSLVLPNGTVPKGAISIEIKEALQPSEWLLNNLSTSTTDGEMLQTGGMFYLAAKAGGKELKIKKGANLSVLMPAAGGKTDPNMQLFSGKIMPGKPTTWTETSTNPMVGNALPTNIPMGKAWENRQHIDSLVRLLLCDATFPKWTPKTPKLNALKLALAKKKTPLAPTLVKPMQPIAPACWEKKKETLTRKEEKENTKYKRNLARFEYAIRVYERKWASYYADSAAVAQAVSYREGCRKNWLLYEDSLFNALIINKWNAIMKPERTMLIGFQQLKNATISQNMNMQQLYCGFVEGKGSLTSHRNQYRRMLGLEAVPKLYVVQKIKQKNKRIFAWLRGENYIYQGGMNPWHKEQFDGYYAIIGKNRLDFLKSRSKLADLYDEIAEQEIVGNVENLKEYAFSINGMGWTNCDRFLNRSMSDTAFVLAKGEPDTRMYLFCPSINASLPMYYNNSIFESGILPNGLPVKLIAIKLDNGSPALCIQDMVTGNGGTTALVYERMSLRDLRMRLEERVKTNERI